MSKRSTVVTVILTAVIASAATALAKDIIDYRSTKSLYEKTGVVKHVMDEYFLYDYDETKMADYAALGMTMSVNDPYTVYYSKAQFSDYMDQNNGDFVGIGIVVTTNGEDEIVVVSPYEDSPGAEAGILGGDIIKAIDGKPYAGSELSSAIDHMRGTEDKESVEGTTVTLTIVREGGAPFDIVVERKRIHTDSVKSEMLTEQIGYLRISEFNTKAKKEDKDTFDEFSQQLQALQDQGMKKLILDVRDNPGGDVNEVSKVLDTLLPKGLIMYTQDKQGRRNTVESDEKELDIPMVILANGNSASAAELMTGALKDYNKATVIGTKTFGKGVMQTVLPLPDGSGMVVTTAKYYTPNGICVQDVGITPDIEVKLPEALEKTPVSKLAKEQDTQLQKALEIIETK